MLGRGLCAESGILFRGGGRGGGPGLTAGKQSGQSFFCFFFVFYSPELILQLTEGVQCFITEGVQNFQGGGGLTFSLC